MKSVIIYKGKYGATRQYAEWLGTALHLPLKTQEELQEADIKAYDFIIVGSSVYIGKLLIREWIKQYAGVLKNKKVVLFVVCGSNNPKDREKIIKQNVPDGLVDPSHIFFLPGRLIQSKLSWKDKFMLKVGAMLVKDPEAKKFMLQDRDNVKEENISAMISKIETLLAADNISF
ncbi:flavodoxin domain-containing protein [Agriterribacter sp.]|uniref:flavodoxin domain-containing protein n=1 Tax=Agriterribacter sp. TaxID=2821509 RepID=UPI002C66FB4F|nr:flavodoxin domain-containing protein [Agriterribacter sp.]HRO47251.1 flavodoxin domain-containing protein [Agriterribacter sp.]HRQ19577.1 flavodoxin domain-containing protein [Agriterribacter sp.]